MDFYTNSEWGNVGGYINTTPMTEYVGYLNTVMPPACIVPGLQQLTVPPASASTASTTTVGSTSRRTLTDDDRRRMREYHESHPGVKQIEIGAMFGVERSTVSKALRKERKRLLNSNDGSRGPTKKRPTKKAKGELPDIERALVNWAKKEQAKGKPLDLPRLREQAQRFAGMVGNPENLSELTSSAWLKYNTLSTNGHSNLHESDGVHVVDSNTTSLPETSNSYAPVSSPSSGLAPPPTSPNQTHRSDNAERSLNHSTAEPGTLVKPEGQDESMPRMPDSSTAAPVSDSEESLTAIDLRQVTKQNESNPDIHSAGLTSMQPPPVPPLPRSENTSPVSSGSPTQDDARRALDLVWGYVRNQPAVFVPDEFAVVGKLMGLMEAVLPGQIDKSPSSRVSKKRKVEARNSVTCQCILGASP